jgi:aminoglycoside phosphotransferase
MQLAGGGGSFLAAAQQGMFAIDTVAANQMMASIEQIQESLEERLRRIHDLKTEAMLGDLHEAQAIAKIDTLVAAGDPQSLDFVLRRFTEILNDLHQAVETCTRNYEQVDTQASQGFRRISDR